MQCDKKQIRERIKKLNKVQMNHLITNRAELVAMKDRKTSTLEAQPTTAWNFCQKILSNMINDKATVASPFQ